MAATPADASGLEQALAAFAVLRAPQATPIPCGLINQSFAVRDGANAYVLQRVSPIFSPRIHDNIHAVTEHLAARGFPTLRLVPTAAGDLCADLGSHGRWRLLTRLPGTSFDVCATAGQARAAGTLVARFHGALVDFDAELHPPGIPLHDTAAHLATLEKALGDHEAHPLYDRVAPLAERVLQVAANWGALDDVPRRVVHGDLKFNNLLFAGEHGPAREEAVGLIDLDLVSRQPLWHELGDAWRSWCNRNGEDVPHAELDPALLEASARAWLETLPFRLEATEREALVFGLERIALELTARFAADALNESYFGWDAERFASRGEHNLVRAHGQWSLHEQAVETRAIRAALLAPT